MKTCNWCFSHAIEGFSGQIVYHWIGVIKQNTQKQTLWKNMPYSTQNTQNMHTKKYFHFSQAIHDAFQQIQHCVIDIDKGNPLQQTQSKNNACSMCKMKSSFFLTHSKSHFSHARGTPF